MEEETIMDGNVEIHQHDPTKPQRRESGMPQNSITEAILNNNEIDYERMEKLKEENNRLKSNNLDLKMQVIDLREKLLKIFEIVNKK